MTEIYESKVSSLDGDVDVDRLALLWKREVECRMLEWGMVDPRLPQRKGRCGVKSNEKEDEDEETSSKKFWDDMVDFCERSARGELEPRNGSTVNLPEMLPEDPVSAVRLVLDQEIRSMWTEEGFVEVTDTLSEYEVPSYIPPYWYDADTGRSGLKAAYKYARIPSTKLNPLVRFQFERVCAKDQLESQYVTNGTPESVAFRAMVGHGACFADGGAGAACVQCSARKVRWNGYFDNASIQFRYWKKLVCENCGSVYEIKSARTIDAATRKFNNGIDGGNFLEEYAVVQKELREISQGRGGTGGLPAARQFVAMMVTDETAHWDGNDCWPVYAAAVERVVPQLKDRSFERGDDRRPKVYTRIFFERSARPAGPRKPWFHIPVFEYDAKEMAAEIIASL